MSDVDPMPDRGEGAGGPALRPPGTPARRRRWVLVLVGLVALAGVLWALRRTTSGAPARAADPQASRPVPVTAAPVVRRDVPIYLEGLGNVVASKTVTVRAQIDGRLDQVLFTEGQAVRAGQALALIDPRPFQAQLHQAEGALARDQAQLASARLNLERYRPLAQEKLIPQQQVDDQAATVGQLEGTVQIDRAAIEVAHLNLDYARIASPVDGVTGIRLVDQGNVVHAADPGGIVIVTQLDPVAVVFTLPQDNLPAVAEAMAKGALAVEAFSRDGATLLGTGALTLVDNQINQATSTIRLKAAFPNPRHLLWPNQFVNARLRLAVRPGALVMPATAIQRGPNGTFVYVIGSDATVSPRPVEPETTQGDLVLVARGLQEGEQVVVDGQNQLRPGSKIVARDPAKAGGGGAAPAPTSSGPSAARSEATPRR
jgi:multidrug efflux system membrane fusion protein